jgi:hypothetical protein
MARILGSVFGEMRGKMGGLVFARNARGPYVRAYAIPVNPNTDAQAQARNTFATSIGSWHTLTDVQKSLWHEYASNYFSSKTKGNLAGGHTGANAFMSLRNVLNNMARKTIDVGDLEIGINGTPVTVPTQASVILPTVPPAQPFQPILGRGNYAIVDMTATSFDTSLKGSITLNLVYTGGSGPSPTPPDPTSDNLFEDANESSLGVAIYASNPLAQSSQFVQNPNILLVSATGLITGYTTTPAVPATVEIGFDGGVFTGYQRTEYLEGQSVRLDAYLYNSYGETSRIGSSIIEVSGVAAP